MITVNPVELIKVSNITFGENNKNNNNVKFQATNNTVDNRNLTVDQFEGQKKAIKTQDNISGLKKAYKIFFTHEYDKQIQEQKRIHLPYMA